MTAAEEDASAAEPSDIDALVVVSSTEPEIKVVKRRWYLLALLSLFTFWQVSSWNK